MKLGKRFVFATIAIICISVTTCLMEYGGEIYFKLVGLITGLFIIGQSITDTKKKEEVK